MRNFRVKYITVRWREQNKVRKTNQTSSSPFSIKTFYVEAQLSWESICLTSRGSQVRALQFPPMAWQFSWLERRPVTAEVVGSSPIQVAIFNGFLPLQLSRQSRGLKILVSLVRFRPEAPVKYADLAHLVERHLAKVEVASSSLVIRSRKFVVEIFTAFLLFTDNFSHSV